MKIPLTPPSINELEKLYSSKNRKKSIAELITQALMKPERKEYLHWDKLRHLDRPKNWSAEEEWLKIKIVRIGLYEFIPFLDKSQKPFRLATPANVLQQLYAIDRY